MKRSNSLKQLVGGLRWLGLLFIAGPAVAEAGPALVVTNVAAAQQPGTKLVNIQYTISDSNATSVNVYMKVSQDSGATWTVPAVTFSGDYGTNISVSANPITKAVVWNAGADWDGQYSAHCRVRVIANDTGLLEIPGGKYQRGNFESIARQDTDITDAPPTTVSVSAYLVDPAPVTAGQWTLVVQAFASSNGYAFDGIPVMTPANNPVQTVNWFDAVKWCNARSEMEGASPVYYADSAFTTVYRSGDVAPYINPNANGYRLPTEAEWEIAARGGNKYRFPWGETITESQANYTTCFDTNKCTPPPYDLGPYGPSPGFTTQVGSYPPNAYGLFDMAGNVAEWCWDWYDPNYYNTQQGQGPNPQGPSSGTTRVYRGGSYRDGAANARCAFRGSSPPNQPLDVTGFRCVRAL